MPIYEYTCPCCGKEDEVFKPMKESERQEFCSRCGSFTEKQMSAPTVLGDYAGYSCPVTGKWIEGRKAHEENLKVHGCRVLETGEKEAKERSAKQEEVNMDKAMDRTMDEFITKLPAKKKEQLTGELQRGADAVVVKS